jgi:hypothetical protein
MIGALNQPKGDGGTMREFGKRWAGYGALWFLTIQILISLWLSYRSQEIINLAFFDVSFRSYGAPSWESLAKRVRDGEILLSKEQQADRFQRVGHLLAGLAEQEADRARLQVEYARRSFVIAAVICLAQLALSVWFVLRRQQERLATTSA